MSSNALQVHANSVLILARIVVVAAIATACGHQRSEDVAPAAHQLEIATTTSVVNSGLLDFVFRDLANAPTRIHATGSGRALAMLADRTVDFVITHAPEAEERTLAVHRDWVYQKLAYNHFVILGPALDPAGVGAARTAVEAFNKIAANHAMFVSRGDESGTHERELALWRAAGVTTTRLFTSGGSMGTTLRQADEQLAYTLSDESTWWQLENGLSLRALVADAKALVNTYAVIYANDSSRAAALAAWLTSREGRERISSYRIADHPAFTVWPARCPAATPASSPFCGAESSAGARDR